MTDDDLGREAPETLDLSGDDTVAPSLAEPTTEDYDPAPEREKLRGTLALLLVSLLIGIVLLGFVSVWFNWVAIADLKQLLELVFTPVVTLVGAVTGFYYGERSK